MNPDRGGRHDGAFQVRTGTFLRRLGNLSDALYLMVATPSGTLYCSHQTQTSLYFVASMVAGTW